MKDLRRVAGLQELHFMQPIENTSVDIQSTCDVSQVSELQRQITDLQGRLSIALEKTYGTPRTPYDNHAGKRRSPGAGRTSPIPYPRA